MKRLSSTTRSAIATGLLLLSAGTASAFGDGRPGMYLEGGSTFHGGTDADAWAAGAVLPGSWGSSGPDSGVSFAWDAQQRRRVQRDEHAAAILALHPLAAFRRHRHRMTHQRPRRGGAQRHQRLRLHQRDLVLEPVQAGRLLALRGALVDAALAAQLELEVLDGVGDEHRLARDAQPPAARDRAACRPGRRRDGPAGLPGRRAARPPASAPHASRPSPVTDCVANSPIGHSRHCMVAP
jgi:hypothetical protein